MDGMGTNAIASLCGDVMSCRKTRDVVSFVTDDCHRCCFLVVLLMLFLVVVNLSHTHPSVAIT